MRPQSLLLDLLVLQRHPDVKACIEQMSDGLITLYGIDKNIVKRVCLIRDAIAENCKGQQIEFSNDFFHQCLISPLFRISMEVMLKQNIPIPLPLDRLLTLSAERLENLARHNPFETSFQDTETMHPVRYKALKDHRNDTSAWQIHWRHLRDLEQAEKEKKLSGDLKDTKLPGLALEKKTPSKAGPDEVKTAQSTQPVGARFRLYTPQDSNENKRTRRVHFLPALTPQPGH